MGCPMTLSAHCKPLERLGTLSAEAMRRSLFLTEDLALFHFYALRGKRSACARAARRTIAVTGGPSKWMPHRRTLPLFHIKEHAVSLGIVADCPGRNHGGAVASAIPGKKWFALLWGKAKQLASNGVVEVIKKVQRYIPVVSTCVVRCDSHLPSVQALNVSTELFEALVAQAVMMIGVAAPDTGVAAAEALGCGTFVVARGRNFGYEFAGHRMTVRFRKPVAEIDRIVRKILAQYGFLFNSSFDEQPPPNAPAALGPLYPFLPPRYSIGGYRAHVRRIFGVDEHCRIVDQQSFVQRSLAAHERWTPAECSES